MTKGRPATRGMDDAVAIARKRGCTMRIMYGLESVCDLMVRTATHIVIIKTRRLDRITATIAEIEHACRPLIAGLRLFPASEQIVLELWAYNKYGTYRFFRIGRDGLVELERDGEPAAPVAGPPSGLALKKLPNPVPAPPKPDPTDSRMGSGTPG